MPASVTTVDVLQQYLLGVVERADDHADDVNEVVISLVGAIIWRKDHDAIEVWAQNGDMKNVLWVHISGQRYAFSYNHDSRHIEMRRNSTQGPVVSDFSNAMSAAQVRAVFAAL